jgi:RNA polymerase sigma factor (sigma-70 family)
MTDEERAVLSVERMCWKAAGRYSLPGYDTEDLVQEARLAALKAYRAYDPAKGCKFSSWAHRPIQNRLSSVAYTFRNPKNNNKKEIVQQVSLDELAYEDGEERRVDLLAAHEGSEDLRIACEQLCRTPIDRDILYHIQRGLTMEDVCCKYSISRERVRQVKNRLLKRFRDALKEEDGLYSAVATTP